MQALSGLEDLYGPFREQMISAGHLVSMGVPGLYGRGGEFEAVIQRFDRLTTEAAREYHHDVMRFPPIFARDHYERLSHIRNFPDLLGSVHTFIGTEGEHRKLLEVFDGEGDWSRELSPAAVMLVPACCYPLYPTVAGHTLAAEGRRVDLEGYVFRHEPSPDPARMQLFRQREFVRLGTPEQALTHRDYWVEKATAIFARVGLKVDKVVASDPFFGRGGRQQKAIQLEQVLKWELVYPICSAEKPTAIASSNYHLDTFGATFDFKTSDGAPAHSSCVGFGLERIGLALFKTHGMSPKDWPREVRDVLGDG